MTLSGQARFVKLGYKLFKKHLKNFDKIDFFIHTWKDHDYKKAIKLYKPKDYIVEKQKKKSVINDPILKKQPGEINYHQENGGSGNWVHYSMFYSIQQSYKLIPKGYDIIVRSRFDIGLVQDFDFFKGVFEANKVYAADVCRNAGVISDWLFWGRPNAMKKILNTYDLMPEHNKNNVNMTSGEDIINATLKQKMIKRQKLPIDVRLIRKDGNKLFSDQWIWDTMLEENYLN
jgi:hypothetical protein